MATVDECREALRDVAARIAADAQASRRASFDRSLACHVRDLDVYFHGRLAAGTVSDVRDGDDPGAQIRLSVTGDDLLALVAGELSVASAWAAGRVSIKASFGDLLKLRKLL